MSSATKTLELLKHFTLTRPEIGLSDLCRLAGRDKATTYRYLQSLEDVGFVEQNATTKLYRLGPALLHLAQIREATVPRKAAAEPTLQRLADATGETAHVAVLSGTTVYALHAVESPKHSTRAVIDVTTLPLHATASGICALAFGPADLTAIAQKNLRQFTSETPVTKDQLWTALENTRDSGFASSLGTFESDVFSIAVPLYDQTGAFAGSVAVASVATRFTPELEAVIKAQLAQASQEITRAWGGSVPSKVATSWSETLLTSHGLEAAQ